ncbi:MAG: DNA polymerase III subunit delta' [Ectothiorhodospira sp.]
MGAAPYPWLEADWKALWGRVAADRVPQGLMIAGPQGAGKGALARAYACSLLCSAPGAEGGACGHCHACRMVAAGAHPDLIRVGIQEKRTRILVDQIRELSSRMALSRSLGAFRIAVIEPAEAMGEAAANSLLKTLEEPPAGAVLILVTAHPSRLPATIRSRCQILRIPLPDRPQARAWLAERISGADLDMALALGGGSPLRAQTLVEEGVMEAWRRQLAGLLGLLRGRGGIAPLAEALQDVPLGDWVDRLQTLCADAVRWRMTGEPGDLTGVASVQDLQVLNEALDLEALFELREHLLRWRGWVEGNLNPRMALEDMLVTLRALARPVTGRSSPSATAV